MLTEKSDKRRLCIQSSRRLNVVVNAFFVLCGALLLLVGSILMKQFADLASFYKITLPAGVIVLGIILAIVGIYGFVAANVEKTKYLIAYFIVLFIIISCEFGIAGAAYTIHSTIPQRLQSTWVGLSPTDKNTVQTQYSCCGWSGPTDNPGPNCNVTINNTTNSNSTHNNTLSRGLGYQHATAAVVTPPGTVGCGAELISLFSTAIYGVGTALVILATFQLLGLISSVSLWLAIVWDRYKTGQERVF